MQSSPYDPDFLNPGLQQLPYFQNAPTHFQIPPTSHFHQSTHAPILQQAPSYPLQWMYDWEYAAQAFIDEMQYLAKHMRETKLQLQQEAQILQARRMKLCEEREKWNEMYMKKPMVDVEAGELSGSSMQQAQ